MLTLLIVTEVATSGSLERYPVVKVSNVEYHVGMLQGGMAAL